MENSSQTTCRVLSNMFQLTLQSYVAYNIYQVSGFDPFLLLPLALMTVPAYKLNQQLTGQAPPVDNTSLTSRILSY